MFVDVVLDPWVHYSPFYLLHSSPALWHTAVLRCLCRGCLSLGLKIVDADGGGLARPDRCSAGCALKVSGFRRLAHACCDEGSRWMLFDVGQPVRTVSAGLFHLRLRLILRGRLCAVSAEVLILMSSSCS